MRNITEQAINAFENSKPFNKENTTVEVLPNVTILKLYKSAIAYQYNDPQRTLSITTAGYNTKTTLACLNALKNVSLRIKQGQLILNGNIWNGELIDII